MLDTTLSTTFIPGTNLTGGLASAPWRFLLPNLEIDYILCLGAPPTATLGVLAAMSHSTWVISSVQQEFDALRAKLARHVIPNVRMAAFDKSGKLQLPDRSVALVFLAGKSETTQLLRDPSLSAELRRVLQEDGVIYLEVKELSAGFAAGKIVKRFADLGFTAPQVLWLTPLRGELRTAFPLDQESMAGYLFSHVLYGQSFKNRMLSRTGALLSRAHLLRHLAPRRALLLPKSREIGERHAPPRYLCALAEKAGVNLSGLQCGLSARGKFNANKTVFYLFDRRGGNADIVAKMTRAPEFNHRLENEYRVLSLLHQKGFAEPGTFPQPLFFGYHANLAIFGQKAVHGEPFRSRTKATADCPIALDAINWIVKLGASSCNNSAATTAQVAETLMQLFRRFAEIYPLSAFESEFLVTQITGISRISKQFPLVFQHGDPGTWNMLVSAEDRVIVIDWEAGEPQGMPLWDLFYFLRTYGSWVARSKGEKDSLASFTQNFLEPSPLHTLLVQTTDRYHAGIGLESDFIAPLFYTCWMHRALKESTRLTASSLANGHYFNLLRRCIEKRNAPALEQLFSLKRPQGT
jgi:hypothetical protein